MTDAALEHRSLHPLQSFFVRLRLMFNLSHPLTCLTELLYDPECLSIVHVHFLPTVTAASCPSTTQRRRDMADVPSALHISHVLQRRDSELVLLVQRRFSALEVVGLAKNPRPLALTDLERDLDTPVGGGDVRERPR